MKFGAVGRVAAAAVLLLAVAAAAAESGRGHSDAQVLSTASSADSRREPWVTGEAQHELASAGGRRAVGPRRSRSALQPAPDPEPAPGPEPDPAVESQATTEPESEQRITVEIREIRMAIDFPVNEVRISREFLPEVEKVAAFMGRHPRVRALVEGHTDSSGDADQNRQLSWRRADAVKAELVTRYGIDAGRIDTIGHGQERPITDNDTEQGRRMNRRVIASIQTEVTLMEVR